MYYRPLQSFSPTLADALNGRVSAHNKWIQKEATARWQQSLIRKVFCLHLFGRIYGTEIHAMRRTIISPFLITQYITSYWSFATGWFLHLLCTISHLNFLSDHHFLHWVFKSKWGFLCLLATIFPIQMFFVM